MESLDEIYNDLIMEHSMNSSNKKELDKCDYCEMGHNPNCGDEIKIQVKLNGNIIEDMAFTGHGCAISQAAADLVLDEVIGKNIEEVKHMTKEDVLDLLGLETLGPARMKCALLSLKVLKSAIYGVDEPKNE